MHLCGIYGGSWRKIEKFVWQVFFKKRKIHTIYQTTAREEKPYSLYLQNVSDIMKFLSC